MMAVLVVVPFFVPNGLVDQFYRCGLGLHEGRFSDSDINHQINYLTISKSIH